MRIDVLTRIALCSLMFAVISCEEPCEEPDVLHINSLFFELQAGGDTGFTPEALEAIFFVRYVPSSEPLIADTFYAMGNFPEGPTRFLINDQFPFRNNQSPYYTDYNYLIVDPTSDYAADIENIILGGYYDGECGYTNTKKQFVLDGDTLDLAGSQDYYLLTR